MIGRPPKNEAQLKKVRGLDARRVDADAIFAALDHAAHMPDEDVHKPPTPPAQQANGAAVALALAWLSQVAKAETSIQACWRLERTCPISLDARRGA